jgi:hypothetical protein
VRKPKWVRGKALEVVMELNAMRPGDEVLVNRIESGQRWERAKKTVLEEHGGGLVVRCCCNEECGLPIPLEHTEISGWRRFVDK